MKARAPLLLVLAACGDLSLVRVIDDEAAPGEYRTRDVPVGTLSDFDGVAGDYARFLGGAKVSISVLLYSIPEDRGASADEFVDNERPVSAHWVRDGETVAATDFASLQMFSAYKHLERAGQYFGELGVTEGATAAVDVYYEPELTGAEALGLGSTDNAAFFLPVDGFLLLRHQILQDIPFGMNAGVMAHEFSHRVWYYETWGAELFGLLEGADANDPDLVTDFNLTRGTDEGVADFFAAMVADNPRFMAASVPEEIAEQRALDVARQVDASWVNGTAPTVEGAYDPYALGAVVASTLWRVAEDLGRELTAAAVIEAERVLHNQLAGSLTYDLGDFEKAFLSALGGSDRATACTHFAQAYSAVWTRFTSVCP